MLKSTGLGLIVVLLTPFAAGFAQTPAASPAVTKFDATYEFVSATEVNETWNIGGMTGRCRGIKGGPLSVMRAQARYKLLTGEVGPEGQLAMRYTAPRKGGGFDQRYIIGSIDNTGTIRARRITELCSQDIIYRKT